MDLWQCWLKSLLSGRAGFADLTLLLGGQGEHSLNRLTPTLTGQDEGGELQPLGCSGGQMAENFVIQSVVVV